MPSSYVFWVPILIYFFGLLSTDPEDWDGQTYRTPEVFGAMLLGYLAFVTFMPFGLLGQAVARGLA